MSAKRQLPKAPTVGVVLVNYHTCARLVATARLFSSFEVVDAVVVVNNETTDEDVEGLSDLAGDEKVSIIYETDNLGYSRGNNVGILYLAETYPNLPYVVIANSDIDVAQGTVEELVALMEKRHDLGAAAPRMLDNNGDLVSLQYVPLGYVRLALRFLAVGLDRKTEHLLMKDVDGVVLQHFLPGSFLVCRMQALRACEYFDQNVFLYREEEILGKRLERAGYRLGVYDEMRFKHNHDYQADSLAKILHDQKFANNSEAYFFREYLGANALQMAYVRMMGHLFTARLIVSQVVKAGRAHLRARQ